MTTIYERYAVCLDATWNALSTAEQAEYDYHVASWALYLAATKSDLVTLDSGCREVIIWNEFGELPQFIPTADQIGTNDVDNYTIFRAHSTARNNGSVTTGLKMAGAKHNYVTKYVLFDGFIFDEGTDGTSGDQYYLLFYFNHYYMENCVFANLYYTLYNTRNSGYYKNCLFYNFNIHFRNGTDCTFYNCGFYSTFTSNYSYVSSDGAFYNCWAYVENRATGVIFHADCTGDKNYATDGSGPIADRDIDSFGFTDADNGDFTITDSSPLFDSGGSVTGLPNTDIAGDLRTQGVKVDIGPFEVTVSSSRTFKMTNIPTGAEVRIYEASTTAGVIGTVELSGIESWTGGDYTYTYTYTEDVDIAVQIIASGYTESVKHYTLENSSQTIPIVLEAEENL